MASSNICKGCLDPLSSDKLQEVKLLPCNHIICMPCMIDGLSKQEFPFTCPGKRCGEAVDSHEHLRREKSSAGIRSGHRFVTKTNTYKKNEGIAGIDDCRIYRAGLKKMKREHPESLKDTLGQEGVLSINGYLSKCTHPTDINAPVKLIGMNFCNAIIPMSGDIDDDNKQQLVRLFGALSKPLLESSREKIPKNPMAPTELVPYIVADERVLPLCMAALATGYPDFDWLDKEKAPDPQQTALICTPHLASDILLRKNPQHYTGITTQMLSFAADNLAPSTFRDLLSSLFRITVSRKTTRMYRAKQFLKKGLEEEELGMRDLVIAMMDNIEHKVLFGKDAGTYKSNTTVAFRQMSSDQLKKDGILNDGDASHRLSRQRKDWKKDIVDKSSAEVVCKNYLLPRAEDYDAFCSLVLMHMASVLMSKEDNWFDDKDSIKVPTPHRMFTQKDYNSNKPNDLCATTTPSVNDEVEGGNQNDEGITRDLFEKNNIKSSFALPMPFGSIVSTVELMEMVMRVGVRQLKEFYDITDDELNEGADADDDDYNETDHQHNNLWKMVNQRMRDPSFLRKNMDLPPSQTILVNAGDGSPFAKATRLKYGDTENRWKNVVPWPGVFHFYMETFKKANLGNEDVVRWLVGTYIGKQGKPATDNNINYFINFGDPTQCEKEKGMIIAAVYDHAATGMIATKQSTSYTATDLLDYMLETAKNRPRAMAVLKTVWFWELSLLVRKSERTNDIDLFFSCVRLSLMLFGTTNASECIRICTDLVVYWETCSAFEKKCIKQYGFTVETPNGVCVGVDYCHEKYVRLIRESTGKTYATGFEAKLEHSALCAMEECAKFKPKRVVQQLRDTLRSKPTTRKWTDSPDLVVVYLQVIKALMSRQVFTAEGELAEEVWKAFEPELDKLFSNVEVGAVLDATALDAVTIGLKRVMDYFIRYYIDSQDEKKRSKKEADISSIADTAAKGKTNRETLVELATSTSIQKLGKKDHTREKLVKEYNKLLEKETDEDATWPALNPNKNNKSDIVRTVAKLRTKPFKKDPQLKEQLKKAVIDEYEKKTTVESRSKELDQEFYSFSNCSSARDADYATEDFFF